jgi:hypothetical protein
MKKCDALVKLIPFMSMTTIYRIPNLSKEPSLQPQILVNIMSSEPETYTPFSSFHRTNSICHPRCRSITSCVIPFFDIVHGSIEPDAAPQSVQCTASRLIRSQRYDRVRYRVVSVKTWAQLYYTFRQIATHRSARRRRRRRSWCGPACSVAMPPSSGRSAVAHASVGEPSCIQMLQLC